MGGGLEKPIYWGDCLEGGLGQFVDLREALQERVGWCFRRGGGGGVDTPMPTMNNKMFFLKNPRTLHFHLV